MPIRARRYCGAWPLTADATAARFPSAAGGRTSSTDLSHWPLSYGHRRDPHLTRLVTATLDDASYARLQGLLTTRPDAGTVVVGTRGLRKLRWAVRGRGKSGGVRVIYYWAVADDVLLMLYLYPKSVRNRLTKDQEQALAALAEREFG